MLGKRIEMAMKERLADLVIVNIGVVDVFSQEVVISDVAISDGVFIGIGDYRGFGRREIDGSGKFLIPGLLDAHVHLESTLVTPVEYANVALARGITGVVADPHEIANVAGVDGIRFMIDNSRQVDLDVYFMLPSCVPATAFEHSGAVLKAADLKPLYQEPEVVGLAEVMDLPAVISGEPDMMQKLADARSLGCSVDGHMAGFTLDQLNAYGVAGIHTDHECDTMEGLKERVRRGIYTFVREGTVCKDLLKMLPAVTSANAPMLCFATDDKHLDDLVKDGGVDASVRLAVAHGLPAPIALQMASLNVARCFHLQGIGAIAPGYVADCSIVSDLTDLHVEKVLKKGRLVVENGRLLHRVDPASVPTPASLVSSVLLPELSTEKLALPMKGCSRARIIQISPGSVVTQAGIEKVQVVGDRFVPDTARDQLKIAVVERHRGLGTVGVGIVKGLRLERGAIATTIAHDSHNLIVVGTNDEEMLAAIAAVKEMQGGIVVVDDGRVAASLRLEIGGLMTAASNDEVLSGLWQVGQAASSIAPRLRFNPFLALSFLSLVVIPELKISDGGLFDFRQFAFVDVPVV